MFFSGNKSGMPAEREALPGREAAMPVPARHAVKDAPLAPPFPDGLEQCSAWAAPGSAARSGSPEAQNVPDHAPAMVATQLVAANRANSRTPVTTANPAVQRTFSLTWVMSSIGQAPTGSGTGWAAPARALARRR